MKRVILGLLLCSCTMTLAAKEITEVVFTPQPRMVCQNCEKKIKGNLRFEKGVKKVETDLKSQTITVTFDADKTDKAKIEEALNKLHYEVEEITVEENLKEEVK